MTAVAGILNKQGVAIAADSAVTVSGPNNRKVYNTANKIFTLSKYHPVGIAIYNSAHFMGIPWEVLIKEYRKQLGNKSFERLEEYPVDFFSWLKKGNYFFKGDPTPYLVNEFQSFLNALFSESLKHVSHDRSKIQQGLDNVLPNFIKEAKKNQLKDLLPKDCEEVIQANE